MTERPEPGTPAWDRYWQGRIGEAQLERTAELAGQAFNRVPYGEDYPHLVLKAQCRDCGVVIGQLHVPNCCVERCA